MADLTEDGTQWPAGVYKLERTDPADAGANQDGPLNQPLVNLANRTAFLKAAMEAIITGEGGAVDNADPAQLYAAILAAIDAAPEYLGIVNLAANTVLDDTYAGKLLLPANAITLTMPAANSVEAGTSISFQGGGWAAASTIQRAGADTITPNGVGGVTSIELAYGDTLELTSNGNNTWHVSGGNATQGDYSQSFAHSHAAAGYQKLPGGLIIQWGDAWAGPNDSFVTNTLPLVFPVMGLSLVAMHNGGTLNNTVVTGAFISASQFNLYSGFTVGSNISAKYIAIGY